MAELASGRKTRRHSADEKARTILLSCRLPPHRHPQQHKLRRQPQERHRRKLHASGLRHGSRRSRHTVVCHADRPRTAPRRLPTQRAHGIPLHSRPEQGSPESRTAAVASVERFRLGDHARFLGQGRHNARRKIRHDMEPLPCRRQLVHTLPQRRRYYQGRRQLFLCQA